MTRKFLAFSLAASTLALMVAAPVTSAHADWRGGGYGRGYGYRHGYGYGHRGIGPGAIVGGALLGLGVGALLAAPYVAPPPPRVVYAPPPYYPPAYAYAPYRYAPPPPVYYAPY